jgi:hypothetical protein
VRALAHIPGLISVLCPTRNRPENVERLIQSIHDTATDKVEVVFRTDDDAPLHRDFLASERIIEECGPRITLSQMWNEAYAASHGEIVMQCGDDIVFRTRGWDDRVREVFAGIPDKVALVYGDDLMHGVKHATHGFVHMKWVDTVGYLTPPHFSCDYGDTWLMEVGLLLGRLVYLPDVVTEHMHPAAGKASWDQSHQERLARGDRDNVRQLYLDTRPERARDEEKLRAIMDDYELPIPDGAGSGIRAMYEDA